MEREKEPGKEKKDALRGKQTVQQTILNSAAYGEIYLAKSGKRKRAKGKEKRALYAVLGIYLQ